MQDAMPGVFMVDDEEIKILDFPEEYQPNTDYEFRVEYSSGNETLS